MIEKGSTWVKHVGRFVLDGYFRLHEQGTAYTGLTPVADSLHVYAKDKSGTTELFYKNSAGTERDLSGGLGGSGTANRLAYWSAAQTLAAVGALTQHRLLVADANGLPTNGNALAAGSVLFGGTNGIPEDDNANFFWDDTLNRLGIGTTTPAAPVEILRTVVTDPALNITSTSSVGLSFRVANSAGAGNLFVAGATDDFMPGSVAGDIGYRVSLTKALLLGDSAAIRAVIAASGQVRIGRTTAPSQVTDEKGVFIQNVPAAPGGTVLPLCVDSYADAVRITGRRANGTPGSPSAVLNAEFLGNFNFRAWHSGGDFSAGALAGITAQAIENHTNTARGTMFIFSATPTGSTAAIIVAKITGRQNILIGDIAEPTTGTAGLFLADGTVPATLAANTAGLYANDVAGTTEMFAIDEAGAATQISPHNFTMFEPDPTHEYPWSYYSKHHYIGKEIAVDMWRLVKAVELLSGEKILYVKDLPISEVRNWDQDQAIKVAQSQRELAAYNRLSEGEKAERQAPIAVAVKQPPKWIKDRMKP